MSSALSVHAHGDPEAASLLLLHGLTDSGPAWADAIARWSPTYHVLAPDLLGHGRSPRFTPGQLLDVDPIEHMYAALLDVVVDLPAPPVVVGHSMGAGLGAALGARRPDLVRALVLEDPAWLDGSPWGDPQEETRERLEGCRAAAADLDAEVALGRRELPDWPEVELRPWAEASAAFDLAFGGTGRASLQVPWRELAAAIDVPTLIVTGTEEVILDAHQLTAVTELANPHLEIEVVPDAGHCVRRDRGEAFHAVVDPWIERAWREG